MIVAIRLILYLVFCGYSLASPDTTFTFFPFALFFAQVALDILESGNNLYTKMKISPIIAKVIGVITFIYAAVFLAATFFYTIDTEVVDNFCLKATPFPNQPFTLSLILLILLTALLLSAPRFSLLLHIFLSIYLIKKTLKQKSHFRIMLIDL